MSIETRLRNSGQQGGGGGSSNSAGLAGTGSYYLGTSANDSFPNWLNIVPGSSVTHHIVGTNYYLNATTSLFAGSAGLATNAATYILSNANAGLANAMILLPGSSVTTHISGTNLYINATTGGAAASTNPVWRGLPTLTGYRTFMVQSGNIPNGSFDLYTVPAGKKALYEGHHLFAKSAISGSYAYLKTNNLIYRLVDDISVAAGQRGNVHAQGYVLEPGETFGFRCGTGSGANIWARFFEFDTSLNIKSVKSLDLTSGNTTVYTCPITSNAYLFSRYFGQFNNSADNQTFLLSNGGSGTMNKNWYVVKSGNVIGIDFLTINTLDALGSASVAQESVATTLSGGDFVVVFNNSAQPRQWAWINLAEF